MTRLLLLVTPLSEMAAVVVFASAPLTAYGLMVLGVLAALTLVSLPRMPRSRALAVAALVPLFAGAHLLVALRTAPGFSPPLPTCPDLTGPIRYVTVPFPPSLWCAPTTGDGPWHMITSPLESLLYASALLVPLAAQILLATSRRGHRAAAQP